MPSIHTRSEAVVTATTNGHTVALHDTTTRATAVHPSPGRTHVPSDRLVDRMDAVAVDAVRLDAADRPDRSDRPDGAASGDRSTSAPTEDNGPRSDPLARSANSCARASSARFFATVSAHSRLYASSDARRFSSSASNDFFSIARARRRVISWPGFAFTPGSDRPTSQTVSWRWRRGN